MKYIKFVMSDVRFMNFDKDLIYDFRYVINMHNNISLL